MRIVDVVLGQRTSRAGRGCCDAMRAHAASNHPVGNEFKQRRTDSSQNEFVFLENPRYRMACAQSTAHDKVQGRSVGRDERRGGRGVCRDPRVGIVDDLNNQRARRAVRNVVTVQHVFAGQDETVAARTRVGPAIQRSIEFLRRANRVSNCM